jgi:H+/Cl- antiporter ClcA
MYIGQEGPFVHIASALAHGLIYMKAFKGPFKRIRENKSVQLAVLEAACAVGVSSTFRAPIGGVLFSIEVTR